MREGGRGHGGWWTDDECAAHSPPAPPRAARPLRPPPALTLVLPRPLDLFLHVVQGAANGQVVHVWLEGAVPKLVPGWVNGVCGRWWVVVVVGRGRQPLLAARAAAAAAWARAGVYAPLCALPEDKRVAQQRVLGARGAVGVAVQHQHILVLERLERVGAVVDPQLVVEQHSRIVICLAGWWGLGRRWAAGQRQARRPARLPARHSQPLIRPPAPSPARSP